jgi:hypothetical protein
MGMDTLTHTLTHIKWTDTLTHTLTHVYLIFRHKLSLLRSLVFDGNVQCEAVAMG